MFKYFLIIVFISAFSCQSELKLPDPLEAGWKAKDVCEVLKETDKLRTLKCTFPPGVGHERHFHAEHFGYTLKGGKFRITDKTGIREVDIPSGYDFYNEYIEWHEVLTRKIHKKSICVLLRLRKTRIFVPQI